MTRGVQNIRSPAAEPTVTRLKVRCCCTPGRVLGEIDLPERPTGEGDVETAQGVVRVRQYYRVVKRRNGGLRSVDVEFAVMAHDGELPL